MTAATPITSPSIDQVVNYISTATTTPLKAVIVNLWDDGPVDIVVNDVSLPNSFEVKRIVYVPLGGTFVPLNDYDTRYVTQIGVLSTDPTGLPAGELQETAPTEDGPAVTPGTEPLES